MIRRINHGNMSGIRHQNLHKRLISTLAMLLTSTAVWAQESLPLKDGSEIIPIRPDGQREWRANHLHVDRNEIVPVRPDGQRDWGANSYRVKDGTLVQVRPDGQRD